MLVGTFVKKLKGSYIHHMAITLMLILSSLLADGSRRTQSVVVKCKGYWLASWECFLGIVTVLDDTESDCHRGKAFVKLCK